jgi:hypothetical protein
MWRTWNPYAMLVEIKKWFSYFGKWYGLKILNIKLPYDPAIPLLDIYPKQLKAEASKVLQPYSQHYSQ